MKQQPSPLRKDWQVGVLCSLSWCGVLVHWSESYHKPLRPQCWTNDTGLGVEPHPLFSASPSGLARKPHTSPACREER